MIYLPNMDHHEDLELLRLGLGPANAKLSNDYLAHIIRAEGMLRASYEIPLDLGSRFFVETIIRMMRLLHENQEPHPVRAAAHVALREFVTFAQTYRNASATRYVKEHGHLATGRRTK
jgi:hypothetical protein